MHIRDILERRRPLISFEFFPPKTAESAAELFKTIAELQQLDPAFVTVTYGAGGTTREHTRELVTRIERETKLTAVAHLTTVCHSREDISGILAKYATSGITNIMALGGDPPRNLSGYDRTQDAFRYAAELVRFIRSFPNPPDPRGFGLGVACYPEGHPVTPNRLKEMEYFKQKVDAGADYACTQFFFDNHEFYDFRERCELAGITVPLLAGIMPITSHSNVTRMAELSQGVRYPAGLLRAVGRCRTDADVAKVGVEWATKQCEDLVRQQVRGLHFYTLNRSESTRQVYANLGLPR